MTDGHLNCVKFFQALVLPLQREKPSQLRLYGGPRIIEVLDTLSCTKLIQSSIMLRVYQNVLYFSAQHKFTGMRKIIFKLGTTTFILKMDKVVQSC